MRFIARYLAAVLLGLLAGVPFFVGIFMESAAIAWITGWDLGVVFAVQAIPVAVLGIAGVLVYAGRIAAGGWDVARS